MKLIGIYLLTMTMQFLIGISHINSQCDIPAVIALVTDNISMALGCQSPLRRPLSKGKAPPLLRGPASSERRSIWAARGWGRPIVPGLHATVFSGASARYS
ncbi:MAG TPA: hypothetical protein VMW13_02095 [Dehalococcoidales bacterium]|nr:hypothetical protein [Dehalococcoidales bacterium]